MTPFANTFDMFSHSIFHNVEGENMLNGKTFDLFSHSTSWNIERCARARLQDSRAQFPRSRLGTPGTITPFWQPNTKRKKKSLHFMTLAPTEARVIKSLW